MPIPKPHKNETQEEFISRCMSDDIMQEYDQKVRLGICYSQWDKAKEQNIMKNSKSIYAAGTDGRIKEYLESDLIHGAEANEARKALSRHSTSTSDKSWDGPANERRVKTDQSVDYFKRIYAWRDPEGDESKKTSYRFIHHEVSGDGNPGAANIRACQTAIAVLNGARGGTTIPGEDKQGIWNHVAGHLKDADVEPAELKRSSAESDLELRAFDVTELRVEQEQDKRPTVKGYASIFNRLSEDLGGFREQVAPGAFKTTIAKDDIRALFNHDPNYVLGRTKNGTLKLAEDDKGLAIEIDPPDTQWSRDLQESIKRGDITQMSFGFIALKDKWDNEQGKTPVRTLVETYLRDVSPVTFPAYPQTSVKVRDYLHALSEAALDSQDTPEEGSAGSLEIAQRRQAFLELTK